MFVSSYNTAIWHQENVFDRRPLHSIISGDIEAKSNVILKVNVSIKNLRQRVILMTSILTSTISQTPVNTNLNKLIKFQTITVLIASETA